MPSDEAALCITPQAQLHTIHVSDPHVRAGERTASTILHDAVDPAALNEDGGE